MLTPPSWRSCRVVGEAACGSEADHHGLPRRIRGAHFLSTLMHHDDGIDCVNYIMDSVSSFNSASESVM